MPDRSGWLTSAPVSIRAITAPWPWWPRARDRWPDLGDVRLWRRKPLQKNFVFVNRTVQLYAFYIRIPLSS